jgi:ADP-ribose pyrophosphatase YjhB (NUDIX family)
MRLISVVLGVLVSEDKILLLKRNKEPYTGYWGLPGGKIDANEHVSEAVTRELYEETGIISNFKSHLGFVSEHLLDDNPLHLLLHVCELEAKTFNLTESGEGQLTWFNLTEIEQFKNQIIPSDYLMIEKMVKNKEKNYYDCVIQKVQNEHILKKFE